MTDLQSVIDKAFENRAGISPKTAEPALKEAVAEVIAQLDSGKLRVAEKSGKDWVTHQWLKKAVLLSFRLEDNEVVRDGYTNYFDKVPAKFADYGSADFRAGGFRVVPNAVVRRGSFIARNVVLMPSFVNIGAYVDESTMVDTWATVGSCAQIGKNVHLSGRGRHRRRAGAGAGESDHHRGRLLHRRAFGGCRRRRGRRGFGNFNGRLYRAEHANLQPRNRRGALRKNSAGFGRRIGEPPVFRRKIQPLLRGDRQTG